MLGFFGGLWVGAVMWVVFVPSEALISICTYMVIVFVLASSLELGSFKYAMFSFITQY